MVLSDAIVEILCCRQVVESSDIPPLPVSKIKLRNQCGAFGDCTVHKKVSQAVGLMTSLALLTFAATAFAASNANYTYDALGRLTKIAYSDGVKTTTVSYS